MAFGLASLIGAAVFVVWWVTAPAGRGAFWQSGVTPAPSAGGAPAPAAVPSPPAPSASPRPEPEVAAVLPRGGTIAVYAEDAADAARWLTQAPLVRINRSTDEVEAWVAESWTVSDDKLTYRLKLRPGILWSDGTPLTAADAVASLAGIEALGLPLQAAEIDPLTIEVKFPEPYAPGLRVLDAHPVLPRHASGDRVGLGPYTKNLRGFARNPHYWRTAPDGLPLPYIDQVTLEPASPAAAPGRREPLDVSDRGIRPEEYEALKKLEQDGKVRLFHLGPGLDVDALRFAAASDAATAEKDKPWFYSDVFRRAISAAVDRRQYCQQVLLGACDPVAGPVSPANAAWFNPDLPLGPGSAQVARAMLADLGLRDRTGDGMLDDATLRAVRFSLLIRRGVESSARAATFLAGALREVGVQVDVTALDASRLRARLLKGNYEAIYDRIEMRDTDPAMNFDFWFTPKPTADWQRQINQLMLKNAASFDRIERLQAFVEVQRIYSQYSPALFFGAPHVRVFTSTRVLNARPSPLRPHVLWNAENLAVLRPAGQ